MVLEGLDRWAVALACVAAASTASAQPSVRGPWSARFDTARGTLERDGDRLVLRVPGLAAPLRLYPLAGKLQWDAAKNAARPASAAERGAFARARGARGAARATITGLLVRREGALALEVRDAAIEAPPGR